MNSGVDVVLEHLDSISKVLEHEMVDYTETINYAKEAVERMKLHPLKDVNKSCTQGRCECGRLLYREFKVCPMCERRPLWPEENVKDDDEFCAACQIG